MNDWEHVEVHYANSERDPTYNDMCANAISWEFCYCLLPSKLVQAKGQCVAIIAPVAYFNKFKHVPSCPIYIDDILPKLHPSMDVENEWYSFQSMDDTREMLNRLGYVENKELEAFFLDIYGDVSK